MKNNTLGGARQMEKKSGYSAGPFSVDEIGFIQIADAKVLAAVARGEIDLNRIAREYLYPSAESRVNGLFTSTPSGHTDARQSRSA